MDELDWIIIFIIIGMVLILVFMFVEFNHMVKACEDVGGKLYGFLDCRK